MTQIFRIMMVLALIVSVSACTKKDTMKDDGDDNMNQNDNTQVVESGGYDGPICCNPADLDNPESLLSKRVIYFDFDQSTVLPDYRELVALHARYLNENPGARVVLEGHADERGSREYNLALGERRGNAVANLMRAQGAGSHQVSVVSYGEERPAALCSDESCWSQNRRVVIVYTAK